MPKIAYIQKRFNRSSKNIIAQANLIIKEYEAGGYDLTLRQLYYQFVARDLIRNQDSEYKRLGSVINDARLAGLIDWNAIEDRTRFLRALSHWDGPADIIDACAQQFRLDTRATQNEYVEVWIEKDALIGVIEKVCRKYDVPCFSCRGYVSQSAMWEAAIHRFRNREQGYGQTTHILHLGDHDPSGIDMTRDIQARMEMFHSSVEVKRIALTMQQIREQGPPPNPAKTTDSRYAEYIRKYGNESWELDALEPSFLEELVRKHIEKLTDEYKMTTLQAKQDVYRAQLRQAAENFRSENDE